MAVILLLRHLQTTDLSGAIRLVGNENGLIHQAGSGHDIRQHSGINIASAARAGGNNPVDRIRRLPALPLLRALFSASSSGIGTLLAAAGRQRQHHPRAKNQSQDSFTLFHFRFLPRFFIFLQTPVCQDYKLGFH